MPDTLRLLLADARFPSGDPPDGGGVEAACRAGLVTDMESLGRFLFGRLRTTGAVGAYAAAAVCVRAGATNVAASLWRGAEAEVDARIASPAARESSRRQGGQLLRAAMTMRVSEALDALARATVASGQRPHYPVAAGAVAAVAGAGPFAAAEAAAYASVAGPAFAAQHLLGLDPAAVAALGVDMAPEVSRLASEAAEAGPGPLALIPSFAAPTLEYLAEEPTRLPRRAFASSRSEPT